MSDLTPHPFNIGDVSEHRHPLSWTPDELRNLRTALDINNTLGTPTGITTIVPNATAAAGTVASNRAYGDHTHGIATAAASALTATDTSTEGTGNNFARATHLHSMTAFPWGVIGTPFSSTANNAHTATGTSDFVVANVDPRDDRNYMVFLQSQWQIAGAGGIWNVDLHHGGTLVDRLDFLESESAANLQGFTQANLLWRPTGLGNATLDVRVVEVAGASTLTFQATPATPVTRQFWIMDIGPRV